MATKMYFSRAVTGGMCGYSFGGPTDPSGNALNSMMGLVTTPGTVSGAGTVTANTITGPQSGISLGLTAVHASWISPPLAAGVTVSGTMTFNIWGFEQNMNANSGFKVVVFRLDNTGAIVSTVVSSARGTEMGTSTSLNNWTATPTSTTFDVGDRIMAVLCATDAGGTMGNSFLITCNYNGTTGGASGDTWLQFNETLSFAAVPSGSVFYLTDRPAVTSLFADTTRGTGNQTSTTTCVNNPSSPIQITDTSGGSTIEWYTPPLAGFTLNTPVYFNVWANCQSTLGETGAALNCDVSVVDADGSNAVLYGSANQDTQNDAVFFSGSIATSSVVLIQTYVSGSPVSVSGGQRLRLRIYTNNSAHLAMSSNTGSIVVTYNGTSAGVSGDTFVQLTDTVTPITTTLKQQPCNFASGAMLAKTWQRARNRIFVPDLWLPNPGGVLLSA